MDLVGRDDHTPVREVIHHVLARLIPGPRRGVRDGARHAAAASGQLHGLARRGLGGPPPAVPDLPEPPAPDPAPRPAPDPSEGDGHALRLTESAGSWSWTCRVCPVGRIGLPTRHACQADHDAMLARGPSYRGWDGLVPGTYRRRPAVPPPGEWPHELTATITRAGDTWRAAAIEAPTVTAEGDSPPQALIALGGALMIWHDQGGHHGGRPTHAGLHGTQLAGAVLPWPEDL